MKRQSKCYPSGKIVQIIGAVIDVEFPRDQIPKVYDALKLDDVDLTLEVQKQLGDGIVRTIAMGASEGLRRGLTDQRHGKGFPCRCGAGTLGRIMDVLGSRRDEKGPVQAKEYLPIHRPAPAYDEQRAPGTFWSRGIKVHRCAGTLCQRGKVGLFGGAGVGKTVNMPRTHQQHRQAVQRSVRVCGRGRAYPRGQRLLSRDDRVGGHRQRQSGQLQVAMVTAR